MYKLYVVMKGRETHDIIDVLFMSFRIYTGRSLTLFSKIKI